jgi:hypothetical protein
MNLKIVSIYLAWIPFLLMLPGCHGEDEVTARRLGAHWSALNMSKSVEQEGQVPTDWEAGAFIRTSFLETFANLADGTTIRYQGTDAILKGTVISIDGVKFASHVGEVLADVRGTISSAYVGKIPVTIHGTLRFVKTTAIDASKNAVSFRIEPTDVEDTSNIIFKFLFTARRNYLSHLLADIALNSIQESALAFEIPFPSTLKKTVGVDATLTNTAILSAAATLKLDVPQSDITIPLSFAAMLARADGIWLLVGSTPVVTSQYKGPKGVLDPTMQRVQNYLTEVQSPLAALSLPPTRKELDAAVKNLTDGLAEKYASDPMRGDLKIPESALGDVYGFLSGRSVEAAIKTFAAGPLADRTLTVKSTETGGHLQEAAILKDKNLGDYQLYLAFIGGDAIQGDVTADLQNIQWQANGISGNVAYGAQATARTRLQIELGVVDKLPALGGLIRGATGVNLNIQGRTPNAIPVPIRVTPEYVSDGGYAAVNLAPRIGCQIIDLKLTAEDVGVTIHHPSIQHQFRPWTLVASHEYYYRLGDPKGANVGSWIIGPKTDALQVKVQPLWSNPTPSGLEVRALIDLKPLVIAQHSAEEAAELADIDRGNAEAEKHLDTAKDKEQSNYACGLTSSFAIDIGPAQIETKAFLAAVGDVIHVASAIVGDGTHVVEDVGREADIALKFAQGVGDTAVQDAAKTMKASVSAVVWAPLNGGKVVKNVIVTGATDTGKVIVPGARDLVKAAASTVHAGVSGVNCLRKLFHHCH